MKLQSINSNNNYIAFRAKDEKKNSLAKFYVNRDSAELVGDIVTSAATFTVFKNVGKFSPVAELFRSGLGKKTTGLALGASVIVGAVVKPVASILTNLITKKDEKSKNRPILGSIALGAFNGLTSPLLATSSLFLTIPAVLGINTGARYLTDKKPDKSLKDYAQTQKDNLLVHAIGIAGLGLVASKGKGLMKSWDEACRKAKANHQELKPFKDPYNKSIDFKDLIERQNEHLQEELGNILTKIYEQPHENKIIDSNILLAKFLQTVPDKDIDTIKIMGHSLPRELRQAIKNLKGGCAPSYTPTEAQGIITKVFGNKYSIVREQPLGVGTVAETYLAKDNQSGKEVVIKFLKKGMNKEKIEADRQQVLDLLAKSDLTKNKEEYSYYTKYINTMFDAWVKETDLSLEKEAAEVMASNARKFNVVEPIEVKNNVYVMEKAQGVQLNKLDEELKRRNMTLTDEQVKKIIMNYNEVFIEQLISIPRSGEKIIQADPNSANIFINLDNLDKPLTFLDLGNVLRYDNLTATRNGLGHLDYIFGNSRGIAVTNLQGAILPENITYSQAVEKLTEELNKHVFNNKTKLPTPHAINDFCANVMRDLKIIPNADNANLIKAETTYFSNIFELRNKIQEGLSQEITKGSDFGDQVKRMMQEMKETGDFKTLVRCILTEIYTSVKNASFKTQKHAYTELQEKIKYIENNREQALTTFYGLLN